MLCPSLPRTFRTEVRMKTVACKILRRELEEVAPDLARQATWLPAGLHVNLDRLKEALEGALEGAEETAVLYGACHPDIEDLVAAHRGCRLPGKDCIAAFLGDEERRDLEGRRAFVMTPGWLRYWREIFQEGLGWDEVDARQNFGFYDAIVLLDFGLEPIDELAVLEFFDYTQTPVEVRPARLDRFRELLHVMTGGLAEGRGTGGDEIRPEPDASPETLATTR